MVKKHWAILIGLTLIQIFPTALRAGQPTSESSTSVVGEIRQRVETDTLEVRVYQGKQLVELPSFTELFVVTPLSGPPQTIENLVGKSVAIAPSEKWPNRLEVYLLRSEAALGRNGHLVEVAYDDPPRKRVRSGASREDGLELADNVFKVKQVLVSSRRRPVELKLDGQVIRLKPMDALLVL